MLGLESKLNKSKGIKAYNSTNSMRFIPHDDFVRISDHSDFNHVNTNTYFTVSFWFKHDDGSPSQYETLMSKYDTGANKREWRISIDSNDKIVVICSADGQSSTNKTNTSTYVVDDTDWHHLYFRYDGSKTEEEQRVYMTVDGAQVLGQDGGGSNVGTPSAANHAELNEDDADLIIGGFLDDNDAYSVMFDGKIDEVCYWKGHFHKGSSVKASDYCYNNGNPRDMRYAGGGVASGCEHIGYWKMGEFYNGGAAVPDGTFPVTKTNPLGTTAYSGGAPGQTLVMLNYAGGSPKRTGSNLVRNGDFSTAITELTDTSTANNGADDDTGTDWFAGHSSNTGHTVTNDTSVYYVGGRSVKLVTGASDDYCFIRQTSTSALENGEFYVLEYFWRTSTDTSDDAGQSWGRSQYELNNCIEGDAQYGMSGDGNMGTAWSTLNKWHRVISVGKCNVSDSTQNLILSRSNGDGTNQAKTFWYDNVSVFKLTGSHHGLVQSPSVDNTVQEGVDR